MVRVVVLFVLLVDVDLGGVVPAEELFLGAGVAVPAVVMTSEAGLALENQ